MNVNDATIVFTDAAKNALNADMLAHSRHKSCGKGRMRNGEITSDPNRFLAHSAPLCAIKIKSEMMLYFSRATHFARNHEGGQCATASGQRL